jgi:hypothetical protein
MEQRVTDWTSPRTTALNQKLDQGGLSDLKLDLNLIERTKQNLPAVIELPALSRALNGRHVPEFPAVASRGEGVLETFTSILTLTIEDLCRRYVTLQLPAGQTVAAWAKQAVEGMFGAARLDAPEAPPAAPVRIAVSELPSSRATARPVSGSKTSTAAWMYARPRPGFPG